MSIGVVVQVGDEKERRCPVMAGGEVPEDVVQRRQYRQLHDQGQAADEPSQRVDAVLLVQLHRLGIELFFVVLEFLAQLGDLGRQLALLDHGSPLSDELKLLKRGKGEPDDDGHDHDRDPVSADGSDHRHRLHVGVEEQQKRCEVLLENVPPQVVDGLEDVERARRAQEDVNFSDAKGRWRRDQGTGS